MQQFVGRVLTAFAFFVALGSTPSYAATFNFSFTNTEISGVAGTVTGQVTGLADTGSNQAATGVFVTSFPAALNITLSPAFNWVTASNVTNSFNLVGGVIIPFGTVFDARTNPLIPFIELSLFFPTSRLADFSPEGLFVLGPTIFTRVSEVPEVPLPAALPLFATGLGVLGLLGWRRKRKAQAAA